jgi:hypothetical protein
VLRAAGKLWVSFGGQKAVDVLLGGHHALHAGGVRTDGTEVLNSIFLVVHLPVIESGTDRKMYDRKIRNASVSNK